MRAFSFSSTLIVLLGAVACFEDPLTGGTADTSPSETETRGDGDADGDPGDGDGDPGDGDGDADTHVGDGDGDTGDGDGDGDGEPGENVIVDLFTEACGLTATWKSVPPLMAQPTPIPCDMVGMPATGWMVRYPELMLGDVTFTKVIALVPSQASGWQIHGNYNLDDVPGAADLEFRAEVLIRCGEADVDCVGYFALAVAEGVPNGLFAKIEDRNLGSGMQAMTIAVPLDSLVTLSEPSIVLITERTEPGIDPSPELLIVNPRLVLP